MKALNDNERKLFEAFQELGSEKASYQEVSEFLKNRHGEAFTVTLVEYLTFLHDRWRPLIYNMQEVKEAAEALVKFSGLNPECTFGEIVEKVCGVSKPSNVKNKYFRNFLLGNEVFRGMLGKPEDWR